MKKLTITGNVGKDAEVVKNPANNELFAKFSVGITVGTKDNPKTDWVDITCNGKLVDVAKNYVKKGTKVLVEGFPQAHAYTNKEGVIISSIRANASYIELLGGGSKPVDDIAVDTAISDNTTFNIDG